APHRRPLRAGHAVRGRRHGHRDRGGGDSMSTIRWEHDADGIVTLILDDPNQSANTMNAAYAESIRATLDRLEAERDSITGVVVDDSSAVVGFPEVQLGLLPGAGGVVRTVRMLGIVDALMQLLLQGQRLKPAKAKELGVVDEIVATREELVPAGKAWIKANPE